MPAADRPNRRDRRDGWWRTAPAIAIAVLALIVATASGAYAVGKNSVGSKQLKKNAVTSSKIKNGSVQSSDVKNGSLRAHDFAAGQLAPMPAGASRIFFAKVDAGGNLLTHSAGVTATRRVSEGSYEVTVGFDATPCALTATPDDSFRVAHTSMDGAFVDVVTQALGPTPLSPSAPYPYANTGFSLSIIC